MNLKTHIKLGMHPSVKLHVCARPIDFVVQGEAAVALGLGPIRGEIGVIPLRMTIPFLRRRGPVLAGSLGPVRVALAPVDVSARVAAARVEGRLGGEDGLQTDVAVEGTCHSEMTVDRESRAKVVKIEAVVDS